MARSLWYATRPDPDSPFDAPIELPVFVEGGDHGEPFLTPDGCTLYFASFATGDADLYRVPVLR